MDHNIVFIDGMATAKEAVETMRIRKVEALIVNKRGEKDAYGIVVPYDFIQGVILPDRTSEEVNVFEVMTKPVITVPASMDVRYAARLMIRAGVRTAPVEENGNYVGIITLSALILDNVLF